LRVLDEHTLGWADFRGNLQYISAGNLAGDERVSLIVMDYAHRRRLKVFGRARVVEASAEPDLIGELADDGYDAVVERGVLVAVEAFDWNCPQHITQRFTVAEIAALMPLRDRASVDDDGCA
jgi:predicted pyridoxine 5'-phosphate oxidase superfamily flavin-nucleotide-binding protein